MTRTVAAYAATAITMIALDLLWLGLIAGPVSVGPAEYWPEVFGCELRYLLHPAHAELDAVLTLLTCGGWVLIRRDWGAWRRWWSPLGMSLAVAIAAAWPIAVAVRDPEAVRLWLSHTVGRAAGEIGYTKPFWYYLTTWPTQLLPWTPILFVAAPTSWRRARQSANGPDRFLWWWACSQLAILSLSSGKHHHYLIYALPALSAVIAQGLLLIRDGLLNVERSLRGWQWMLTILTATSVIAGLTASVLKPELRLDGICLGILFGTGCGVLAMACIRRDIRLATMTVVSTVLVAHIYTQAAIMPRRDPSAADKAFLAEVDRLVDPKTPLIATGCQEIARHIFYVEHPVIGVWNPNDIGKVAPLPPVFRPVQYVIARATSEDELNRYGKVEQIAQSAYTRRERTPRDRYTLFKIYGIPVVSEINHSNAAERGQRYAGDYGASEIARVEGTFAPRKTDQHEQAGKATPPRH
ncbi:MAG: hypothetical protein B7Z55_08490 [Planctomycetales bacterium 12-60-4]|nr:MAG: hypothetical protein B7Z55_08490 [Planctomycetales bacterium 12-60-4]